jgi:membrane protein required for colicin V production
MNAVDVFFAAILALALVRGFIKGFVMQLAALVALVLGIYLSIRFSAYLGSYLSEKLDTNPKIIQILSFAILFTAVVIGVHFTGKLAEKLLAITQLSFINRLAGAIFGCIKALLILAVLVTFINAVDQQVPFLSKEHTEKSFFYRPVSRILPTLFPSFIEKGELRKKAEEILTECKKPLSIKGKCYLCENFHYDIG